MGNLVYGLFILGTFASYVALVHFGGKAAKVAKRPFLAALLCVLLPFIIWDIWATHRGHWAFNPDFIIDVRLIGVPIEEVLFFVAIPLICLAVYQLVHSKVGDSELSTRMFVPVGFLSAVLLVSCILFIDRPYTFVVSGLGVLLCIGLLLEKRLIRSKAFWVSLAIIYALFFISNTLLTALPVVTYGQFAVTGMRLGTIPIEDFIYNFILFSLCLLIYRHWSQKVPSK